MGKHARPKRGVRFTLRRPSLVAWVDMRTGVTHLLTPDAAAAGRGSHRRYLAVCGAEVLPGEFTESQGDCPLCHSSVPTQRSRTRSTTTPVRQRRVRLTTGMVDSVTSVEHQVTDESAGALVNRQVGLYPALCGTRVLVASLTAPARGRCGVCDGLS